MFTRPEGIEEFVNVRLTTLENVSWFKPFIETWTKEKLSWVTTLAVRSFETVPEYEDYAGLVEEYTKQASTPG